MYLIKVGESENSGMTAPARHAKTKDFDLARRQAHRFLKKYARVEIVDGKTNECVYFLAREESAPRKSVERK